MPVQGNFTIAGSLQGVAYGNTTAVNSNSAEQFSVNCAMAWAGQLTTRTNNTTGTVTMSSNSHLITTAEVVDVYWDGGSRRNVTIGTVSGTAAPLSNTGTGDNLPAVNTNVVLGPVTAVSCNVNGTNALAITVDVNGGNEGAFGLFASSTEVVGGKLTGVDYIWFSGNGVTNPITGNTITSLNVSTSNVSANNIVRGSIQYN